MSSPYANEHRPDATAAPLPPLEPPGVVPCRQGLWVGGNRSLTVPTEAASSGVFGLPEQGDPFSPGVSHGDAVLLGHAVAPPARPVRPRHAAHGLGVLHRQRDPRVPPLTAGGTLVDVDVRRQPGV